MSFDLDTLYSLLPAIYRIRDLAQISGDTSLFGQVQTIDKSKPALPLLALMKVLAEQIAVLEENLAQLYDDQFIETCAEWAIPYIGDLVGYTLPHDTSSQSLRSEVANTIRYRKRKGTVTLFEQLARDITGWDVHAVEYFQLVATTQHLQRLRPGNTLIDVRRITPPENPPSPFEKLARTIDTRNIATRNGRYNVANIGIFLWRLNAYRLSDVPVVEAAVKDEHRYLYHFNPLGTDLQLFTHPLHAEEVTQLAGPLAVAAPISGAMLARAFSDYYGRDKSLWLTSTDADTILLPDPLEPLIEISVALYTGLTSGRLNFPQLAQWSETLYKGLTSPLGIAYDQLANLINTSNILYNGLASAENLDFGVLAGLIEQSKNLADALKALPGKRGPGSTFYAFTISDLGDARDRNGEIRWKSPPRGTPETHIVIDPVSGRLTCPRRKRNWKDTHVDIPPPQNLRATFSYGFSADMGGGEYHRGDSFIELPRLLQAPARVVKVQEALDTLTNKDNPDDGIVEITDSERMDGILKITAAANQRIELRAVDFKCPLLFLKGRKRTLEISGDDGSEVTINGLVIANGPIHVTGKLRRLTLKHCTLIPGNEVNVEGKRQVQSRLCLTCEANDTRIEIDRSITGRLEIKGSAQVTISNSIVDATREDLLAYAGPSARATEDAAIDRLSLENCTIIGRVHTSILEQASNTIFCARPARRVKEPVHVERRQEGCARYSYLPAGSRLPQRQFQCQAEREGAIDHIEPYFTSLRYGDAGYAQLSQRTNQAILRGADDGAEMGAFHDLFQPQRATNLLLRLREYVRFGFETGIFFQT